MMMALRFPLCSLFLLFALLAAPKPTAAANAGVLDPTRFSCGLQAGVGWHAARPQEQVAELLAVVNPAWNLGRLPSLVAPARFYLQSQQFAWEPKLSVLAYYSPGAQVFAQGGFGFYGDMDGDADPPFKSEPCVAAVVVVPVSPHFALVGNGTFRTRSEQRTVSAVASFMFGGE